MHELSVTQAMLSTALDAAERAGGGRVTAIELVIGELGSMVDDSVQFYFGVLSRGTPAEGAELRVRRVPGEAACLDCSAHYPVRPPLDAVCPVCGGTSVRVAGGFQFLIDAIEVE